MSDKFKAPTIGIEAARIAPNYSDSTWQETSVVKDSDIVMMPRGEFETNPDYRHFIGYAMVRCNGRYLTYERTPKGDEPGLHYQRFIGFGGHIETDDLIYNENGSVNFLESLKKAAMREVGEELILSSDNSVVEASMNPEMIVSSRNEVDAVHAGVVMLIDITNENLVAGEDQIKLLGFKTPDELQSVENLESWSQILVKSMQ
jgi:predicted NUDIX family phosphoesterase